MAKKLKLHFTQNNLHLSKNIEREATHGGVSLFQNLLNRLENKMFLKKNIKKKKNQSKFQFVKASESKKIAMK